MCLFFVFQKNKLEEFGLFNLVEYGEVSEIRGYGSAGHFVAAINGHLFFFKLSNGAYTMEPKYNAHSSLIKLLAPMSDSYMVTGDLNGVITIWKKTENTEFTAQDTYEVGFLIKGGIKCTDVTFFVISENEGDYQLEKYDLALNHYGSSKRFYFEIINAIAMHGQSVVIGLSNGLITS